MMKSDLEVYVGFFMIISVFMG